MKKLLFTLILSLLSFTAISETVTTGNLLTNSTFGSGTSYDATGWTIDSGTHGHSNMAAGGGNTPGGSVAAEENTSIEQTVNSLSTAAGMTVNEIRRGWSSELSSDIWFWNQYDNTTTLKQTITDSEGNVTTQQRVITNTGCGSINCGQHTNYTDTHIQGTNTSDDFSIKVGVSNTNNRTGHYGPDIDDIELKVTYTDVPPIDEDTQEDLEDITEDIEEDIPNFDDIEDIEWEEDFTFEEEYFTWEEDFYFEEDFSTDWEEFDTAWDDYEMDFNDEMYFEEEFTEFEEMEMPEEFEMTMLPEDSFEEMYMEEFEEFETFEDVFSTLDGEEMEMFEEMEEFEEMEMEEEMVEEFEEMPEEFEEMEMAEEETLDMEVEESDNTPAETEMDEEMEMEEEAEEMEVAEDDQEPTEETAEAVEEEPESEESPQEVASDESEADGEGVDTDEKSVEEEKKTVDVEKEKVKTVDSKVKTKIEEIKVDEIKVAKIKPTLFSDQPNLETYSQVSFYAPETLNYEVNDSFFEQVSLDMYNKQIYTNVSLSGYIQNDPVEVHRRKMEEITIKKRTLMIELQQLKSQQ
jgi:hypothetical protein